MEELTNVIVAAAIMLVTMVIVMAFYKRYTAPFGAVISILLTAPFILLCIDKIKWHLYVGLSAFLAINGLFIYFLWMKTHNVDEENRKIGYLDFSKSVMSWSKIINSIRFLFSKKFSNGRVIGKVMPYNTFQLKYNGRALQQSEISAAGATLISGSIGSGKTYGMKSLIKQNIEAGRAVIFAEYKGDPDLVKEMVTFAKSRGYQIFCIEKGLADFNYDPLLNLNNVGRIEAIMNMRKWDISGSDAHYKTGTQLLLQKLVQEFSHKWAAMQTAEISQKDKTAKLSFTKSFYEFVKCYSPDRNEWDSYSTVSKLLELILTSSLKSMFDGENNKTLDFKSVKNQKFMLIVSFVSSNKELATSFSSLLFRDLLDECTVSAPRHNLYLYIDEFGTLENPFIIKDILEKGRSGRIATTLALQDINQIVIQTNEPYLNSVLGIINTFIVYSGATRVTAEKFAGVQLHDIEVVLMNLRKPINGKKPTAIYISKYPTLNKNITSEVFRFIPYIYTGNGGKEKSNSSANSRNVRIETPVKSNDEFDNGKLDPTQQGTTNVPLEDLSDSNRGQESLNLNLNGGNSQNASNNYANGSNYMNQGSTNQSEQPKDSVTSWEDFI